MKKNGKKARKLQKERNLRRSKMREEQALSRTDEIDLTSPIYESVTSAESGSLRHAGNARFLPENVAGIRPALQLAG